ncbi:glucosamine-6-phosphate deaminase [Agromyces sp. SYSU K20354]|uniref:glucosamine-6-phosphate deaminase n=1 Tax=Agromyces cavernae TaxID=2898659 RepID=UPI001E443B5B|nr:glucosamine-6-phosphate deaminase [Agromyces cavernae]MCD2440965.1 glucosamine-6-phosphate deaminase [Agromyces cavernae]
MIEIAVLPDAVAVGERAADVFDDAVQSGARTLGLATGSSTDPLYAELVRRHGGRHNQYRMTRLFQLDEYIGLPVEHPERYAEVIRRSFAEPLGIPFSRVHAPDADDADPDRAGAAFELSIADAGGIDLQLLGVGANGHIAFNEPGTPFESRTRAVELADQTRRDNARFFGGDPDSVPRRAMSQGISTILRARRILLVAIGRAKADTVAAVARTPPTPLVPVSALHDHPAVTMLVDLEAASGIDPDNVLDTVRVSARPVAGGA